MDQTTLTNIAKLRRRLESEPDLIVAGEIEIGVSNPNTGTKDWDEVLQLFNGGRFGVFDIWSELELGTKQFYVAEMSGGGASWLVVGQFLYQPLFLDRRNGTIVCFWDSNEVLEFGDVTSFVSDVLIGERYSEFVPHVQDDAWWRLLCRLRE